MAKACFCLSLPTFGYIIGILNLVLTLSLFFVAFFGGFHDNENPYQGGGESQFNVVITLCNSAIGITVSGLLIYGINKKQAGCVLTYLVFLVLAVAKILIGAVFVLVIGIWPLFFVQLIVCFLGIYITYAIYMLYTEIKESSKATPYHAPV